jgi:prolyl oligopeptidase PreP (S9A serine peptidase family)
VQQPNGTYQFEKNYPRNKYVAVYLGQIGNKLYLLSAEAGDTYGVVAVDVFKNTREVIVPAQPGKVLHTAEVAGEQLVLQYHTIPEQNVSLVITDSEGRKLRSYAMADFGLTPFGNLSRFLVAPGGRKARAVFSDVRTGNHVLELDLFRKSVEKLNNIKDLDFDSQQMQVDLVQFTATDGTELSGRLYTRKGGQPKFAFIRYYGFISIKNSPEVKEVQMALELGGAYLTLDLPGGGERGETWFQEGSRHRLRTISYISEASDYLQERLAMGS